VICQANKNKELVRIRKRIKMEMTDYLRYEKPGQDPLNSRHGRCNPPYGYGPKSGWEAAFWDQGFHSARSTPTFPAIPILIGR
jgi:hypothetical protein